MSRSSLRKIRTGEAETSSLSIQVRAVRLRFGLASTDGGSGKILKDDQTLESYHIEEKGYVVCMVSKV